MNTKAKIILHMGVTLLVGIAIGALLNRAVVQKRMRDVMERRAAGMFLPVERLLAQATPEQAPKLREALDKHGKSLAEIHDEFGRKIQAAMDDLKKEVDPILTAEQKQRLDRMLPGRPPFARGRRGVWPPNGPPASLGFRPAAEPIGFRVEVLKERLSLSDEQAAKIQAVLTRHRETSIRRPPEGQGPASGPMLGQWPRPFPPGVDLAKVEAEIEGVLTEDQKAIFRKLRKERPAPQPDDQPPPIRRP